MVPPSIATDVDDGSECESIQDAVHGASSGDPIVVEDSVHHEFVGVSTQNVSIVAADGGRPVLDEEVAYEA